MRSAPALASALLLVLLPVASAQTCWGFDGKAWGDQFQCEGSSACCGNQGICLPNKLCNSNKNGTGEVIRGTCAIAPYDPVECAEICLYDEKDGRFPRVTICDNGKYCCDNDKDCCSRGRGVFLNDVGKVVETDPSISSSKTTVTGSPSSTPSSSDSVGPATPPTPDPAAPSPSAPAAPAVPTAASGGLATGAKIGIGVAVPVAVLGAAALAAFLWFRKKKKVYSTTSSGGYKSPSQQQQLPQELAAKESAQELAAKESAQELAAKESAQELAAKESAQEMQGFAKEQSNVPIELDAGEVGGGGEGRRSISRM